MILRKLVFLCAFLFIGCCVFADSRKVTLKITGIESEAPIFVAVFDTIDAFKKEVAYQSIIVNPHGQEEEVIIEVEDGKYIFSLFQDINNDGTISKNLFGYPKEPFGLSNYNGGIPGDFSKLSVNITEDTGVEIVLRK